MKKCLAYLLTIVSLFSLMGCTDKNGGTDSSSSGNNGEVVTGMKEIEYEKSLSEEERRQYATAGERLYIVHKV